jgi:hypothetical protein
MVEDLELKIYGIEVHWNTITSILNIMKIYQPVQKLLEGHTHTERQTVDFISLFHFWKVG